MVAQSLYFYRMMCIQLHNVVFHANHGLYEIEKLDGGEFEVDLTVSFPLQAAHTLNDTIDYVVIFELVKKRMEEPTPLLETIIIEISQQILAQFSVVQEVYISIRKLNPPINNFSGSVGASYTLKRDN